MEIDKILFGNFQKRALLNGKSPGNTNKNIQESGVKW